MLLVNSRPHVTITKLTIDFIEPNKLKVTHDIVRDKNYNEGKREPIATGTKVPLVRATDIHCLKLKW